MKLGLRRGYTGAVHVTEVEVDTLLGRTRVLKSPQNRRRGWPSPEPRSHEANATAA